VSTRIVTHSGSFHADDVFGVAVLAALHPDHELVRTRDPGAMETADFLVDVGGEWDAARGRFDHHQRGFDGARASGEGYASAGLVWREFGAAYVTQVARSMGEPLSEAACTRITEEIDASLVRYLDLVDTGAATVAPGAFGLSTQVAVLNATWLEEQGLDAAARARLQLTRFREGMAVVERFLQRLVQRRIGQELAADRVRRAERLMGGRLLFLAGGGMPWTSVVVQEMPDVLLVLYAESDEDGERHVLRTVPVEAGSFEARVDLPAEWAGLRDAELAAVTGVPDALFCHSNLFIAVARSREGALRLAELALASSANR